MPGEICATGVIQGSAWLWVTARWRVTARRPSAKVRKRSAAQPGDGLDKPQRLRSGMCDHFIIVSRRIEGFRTA